MPGPCSWSTPNLTTSTSGLRDHKKKSFYNITRSEAFIAEHLCSDAKPEPSFFRSHKQKKKFNAAPDLPCTTDPEPHLEKIRSRIAKNNDKMFFLQSIYLSNFIYFCFCIIRIRFFKYRIRPKHPDPLPWFTFIGKSVSINFIGTESGSVFNYLGKLQKTEFFCGRTIRRGRGSKPDH